MFKLFDRNNDDTMNPRDLMAALKALGQNPSQEEVRNLVSQVNLELSIEYFLSSLELFFPTLLLTIFDFHIHKNVFRSPV